MQAADGTKLRKVVNDNGYVTTTDYAGNYVYENNDLQFFNTAEGYVAVTVIKTFPIQFIFKYVYQYKDHLGNIRLSYSDSDNNGTISQSEIIEENNYYPFGLKHKGYNSNVSSNGNSVAQKIKFGGFEYQEELNLEWYDMSARNYDPALGRWMNLDPLAELMTRHSPYNYAFDNPVYFIDPDGMAPFGSIGGGDEFSRRMDYKSTHEDPFHRIAGSADDSGGPGDPPINYSGPGAAIGDNVFNLLPELCLNCDLNDEPEPNFTIYGHDPSGDRTGRDGTITHSIESDDFSDMRGGAKTGNILAEFLRVLLEDAPGIAEKLREWIGLFQDEKSTKEELDDMVTIPIVKNNSKLREVKNPNNPNVTTRTFEKKDTLAHSKDTFSVLMLSARRSNRKFDSIYKIKK